MCVVHTRSKYQVPTGNLEALTGLRMIPTDMQNLSALDSGFNISERGYCLMNKVGHGRYFLGYHELTHCFQPLLKVLDLLNHFLELEA